MQEKYTKWVCTWGNASSITERMPENYGKKLTLRYPLTMMFTGNKLRVSFDNFCGTSPVVVSCANVAVSNGQDGIEPDTIVQLTFGGKKEFTIPVGQKITSDEVNMEIHKEMCVAISMYFDDFVELRSGVSIHGPLSNGYFAVGNQTEYETLDINTSKVTNNFYFLTDVDILTEEKNAALICYGDSITAKAWPDYLAKCILAVGDRSVSVVRRAVGGSRVLRQYDCIAYDSYGLKGSTRFPREINDTAGAYAVIVQHGINDIIHPVGLDVNRYRPLTDLPTPDSLINGLKTYIKTAHEKNLKIFLGTLLPFEGWRTYAPFREDLRQSINDWIRTTNDADGFIDFDKAVRNNSNPYAFAKGFDSGDHLHPSLSAHKK